MDLQTIVRELRSSDEPRRVAALRALLKWLVRNGWTAPLKSAVLELGRQSDPASELLEVYARFPFVEGVDVYETFLQSDSPWRQARALEMLPGWMAILPERRPTFFDVVSRLTQSPEAWTRFLAAMILARELGDERAWAIAASALEAQEREDPKRSFVLQARELLSKGELEEVNRALSPGGTIDLLSAPPTGGELQARFLDWSRRKLT